MTEKEKQFNELVREQKKNIYTVCYMFSGDQEEVADLFQEVLINLWQGIDRFRHEAKTSTWVYRIALNTCLAHEKKKQRQPSTISLTMDIDLYAGKDNDTRQIRQLHERINRLNYLDRAIVLLWLENLPYDEIAAITGISVKNVSVRLVRIKEQLKQMH
ncbi:MAG: sigma-70 family RNA polymerase sigma factor [Paludibacteraceae bacterium]|nr:sigma-70 family RNA polymerase sigma factor [Paludibacteraceae bacterium]